MTSWERDQRVIWDIMEPSIDLLKREAEEGKYFPVFSIYDIPRVHESYSPKVTVNENGSKSINQTVTQSLDKVMYSNTVKYEVRPIRYKVHVPVAGSHRVRDKYNYRVETWFYLTKHDYDDRPYSTQSWTTEYTLVYDHQEERWYSLRGKDEKIRREK